MTKKQSPFEAMQYPLVKEICKMAASELGIEPEQILSTAKSKSIAAARHISMYVLYRKGLSYSEIGRLLEKNHATAINAYRKVEMTPLLQGIAEKIIATLLIKSPQTAKVDTYNRNAETFRLKPILFFEKYEACCQVCGYEDIVEIHHMIPRKSGGSSGIDNLRILCPNHHAMFHYGLINVDKLGPPKLLNPPKKVKKAQT